MFPNWSTHSKARNHHSRLGLTGVSGKRRGESTQARKNLRNLPSWHTSSKVCQDALAMDQFRGTQLDLAWPAKTSKRRPEPFWKVLEFVTGFSCSCVLKGDIAAGQRERSSVLQTPAERVRVCTQDGNPPCGTSEQLEGRIKLVCAKGKMFAKPC